MQTSSAVTLAGMSGAVFLASVILVLGSVSQDTQCNEGLCPTDSASLMQGVVHVDLLGVATQRQKVTPPVSVQAPPSAPSSILSDATTQPKMVLTESPRTSYPHRFVDFSHAAATSGVSLLVGSVKTSLRTRAVGSVVLILMLVCCVGAAALVLIYPSWVANKRSGASGPLHSGSAMHSENASAGFPRVSATSGLNMPPHTSGSSRVSYSAAAYTDYPLGHSPLTSHMSPQQQQQQLAPFSKQVPPPLCPTLVMPVCEARFGVPMTDIASLGMEGEISIVGLSGNPLLRAMIRLDHTQQRTLEICMPEKNSAPRATVAPSQLGLATQGYDIRGMKGIFYGFLEIQPCGTCAVVKDGQTVLLLDGDTDNLQLSIKSGSGSQLASVRCSAEPFGGVDHVEIRVEPGVDTVLVLAVVLGVLVLAER